MAPLTVLFSRSNVPDTCRRQQQGPSSWWNEEAEVTIETLGSLDSAVAVPDDEYAPDT